MPDTGTIIQLIVCLGFIIHVNRARKGMPDSTYNEGIAIQNLKPRELKSILLHTGNQMNKFFVPVTRSYKNKYNDKFALNVGRSVTPI